MKRVMLSIRYDDVDKMEEVSSAFSEEDMELLNTYKYFMDRLRRCALLVRGMPPAGMSFNDKEGLTFSYPQYSNAELYELLHVLRPLILQNEQASFYKITSLLKRRFSNRGFSDQIKVWSRIFRHGEYSMIMQIKINNMPLFDESLLDTYLNGIEYHNDNEKASAWYALESSLNSENSRALIMNQLYSKVKALYFVEYIADKILE